MIAESIQDYHTQKLVIFQFAHLYKPSNVVCKIIECAAERGVGIESSTEGVLHKPNFCKGSLVFVLITQSFIYAVRARVDNGEFIVVIGYVFEYESMFDSPAIGSSGVKGSSGQGSVPLR